MAGSQGHRHPNARVNSALSWEVSPCGSSTISDYLGHHLHLDRPSCLLYGNCPLEGAEENKGMLAKGKGQHHGRSSVCGHVCTHTHTHSDVLSGEGKLLLRKRLRAEGT